MNPSSANPAYDFSGLEREHPTFHVCGINQERAALGVRERFALSPQRCAETLERIRSEGLAREALILSTCNRTEIYAFSPIEEAFAEALREFFLSLSEKPFEPGMTPPLYTYEGQEAVRHFFAVSAGLDSMILGENEIKAQVRQSMDLSKTAGLAGANLHRLADAALRCSKRIRTETDLNTGSLSVGRASVLHAESVLGTLKGKVCVVIGAGKVGRVAAEAIAERLPARLVLVNRTLETAQAIARDLGAEAVPIPMMAPAIQAADLILGAAFAPNFLVTRKMFEALRGPNPAKPVCLIDAAVPRILDQAISEAPGVTVYDIGHLEGIIAENRARRTAAAQHAWEIVEEAVDRFKTRQETFSLGPMVERLKGRFESVFEEELAGLERELPEEMREKIRLAQRRLKQRLFHEAISEIKTTHVERK